MKFQKQENYPNFSCTVQFLFNLLQGDQVLHSRRTRGYKQVFMSQVRGYSLPNSQGYPFVGRSVYPSKIYKGSGRRCSDFRYLLTVEFGVDLLHNFPLESPVCETKVFNRVKPGLYGLSLQYITVTFRSCSMILMGSWTPRESRQVFHSSRSSHG